MNVKRWGSFCMGGVKKTHQRPFVGLVFWRLHALAGLTHKLSKLDPSNPPPIESAVLTFFDDGRIP